MVVKTKFEKKTINKNIYIYVISISSKKITDFCLYVEKTKNKKGEKTR